MKIYLREITDLGTDLHFTQEEKWLADAATKVDEHLEGEIQRPNSKPRPVVANFNLRLVDEIVVVTGNIESSNQLVCSRCATSFRFPNNPRFSSLFCKDPVMAGVAHLSRGSKGTSNGRPVGQNKGYARHAHDEANDDEEASNIEINYVTEDHINLAALVTEQLQLHVPFQPLCRESCKGMCQSCGADLNVGRCACSKILKQNPFSSLRDLKV